MTLDNSERPARSDTDPAPRQSIASLAANGLIIFASILVSLLIAEAGYRVATGIALFDPTDWRADNFRFSRIGDRAIPDPLLGWTLKDNYRGNGFTTTSRYGARRNFDETELRTGGILAVGDSFTEGFDQVTDSETWPAHLEKTLGTPVVNGAVAGYATDQIILRAEQLLPVVEPKTLIVGFTEVDIYRSALSESGAPKPYFTIEDGGLVYHPPGPIDPMDKESVLGSALRDVLGHSALGNYVFSRLTPDFWYPSEASVYHEVENQPIDITCLLLGRLKQKTQEKGVRMLLFLQYGGEIVLEEPGIVPDMKIVTECAQKAGIQVVDQFAPLKALTHGTPDLVAEYYTQYENGEFGHMSSKGNEHAASVLAQALKAVEPAPVNAQLEKEKQELLPN
ncbi:MULTISPECIES: hypothetical protein [Rhodomicrobium]|uniref:SGNH/GDSL hydrolase family protein n=1 Tax=Rhodomicrobium TaxID=1068 RepID=UPI000B4BD43A|nr:MULTISPECIES: hypothetical protein [Rhodomicrobium]